jgi:cytochrome c553
MKKLLRLLTSLAVVGLSFSAQAQSAQAGEKKAAMCIGCHGIPGYQASFPEIYKVPMIAGQNAKYIASSLAGYKKGDRKHPTMRGIAASLSDQDMADLAAYYEQLGKSGEPAEAKAAPEPSAEVAGLLKKGNCASCHGENFSKPIDAGYPKLAGQHGDYLYAALREYQTDKNPQVGRNNAIMMGMARPFTHAEAKQLATYMASLPGDLKTVSQSRWR